MFVMDEVGTENHGADCIMFEVGGTSIWSLSSCAKEFL